MGKTNHSKGFTIVELLIVIVIIGILAAIVIVAFNGVQDSAKKAKITSSLTQYSKKVQQHKLLKGSMPATIDEIGIADENGTEYQFVSTGPDDYCIMATSGTLTYFISQSSSGVQEGVCGGYNMTTWNKATGTPPINGVTVDNTTFRTSTASMRIGPGITGRQVVGSPFSGTTGQTITVSLWIRTDASWDGTNSNSKIRFGDGAGNGLLRACGYNGVKTSWTQATCSYTFAAGVNSVNITVGNDGTVGNIWLDDFSVVKA